MQKAFYSR